MAAEDDVPKGTAPLANLTPQQIAAVAAAVMERMPFAPPVPPPAAPSGTMTGADARALQHPDADIGALERYVDLCVTKRLLDQPMRGEVKDMIRDAVAFALDKDQIRDEARDVLREELSDIGLPITEDHDKRETGNMIRAYAWLGWLVSRVGSKVAMALGVLGFWAFLKWAGVKGLPPPPGFGG